MEVSAEYVVAMTVATEQKTHYDLSNGSRVSRYTLRTLRLVYHMSDNALADIFGVPEKEIKALEDSLSQPPQV